MVKFQLIYDELAPSLTLEQIHALATAPLPAIITISTYHGVSRGPKAVGPVSLEDQLWRDRAQQTRESR